MKLILNTNGKGLWSHKQAKVQVTAIVLDKWGESFDDLLLPELRVYFNLKTWDPAKDGLIYTDPLFIKELKQYLKSLGMTNKALNDLDYSEQGMQGDDFVSLDAGKDFAKEFLKLKDLIK